MPFNIHAHSSNSKLVVRCQVLLVAGLLPLAAMETQFIRLGNGFEDSICDLVRIALAHNSRLVAGQHAGCICQTRDPGLGLPAKS